MRYGFNLPNFGKFVDVRVLAELAAAAEAGGWDGFFVWDHLSPVFAPGRIVPAADPIVALTAIALATERIRFGTMVTPLPRRRVQKVAREFTTLDHLSNGRVILGVGMGEPPAAEYEAFGEEPATRTRAQRLDESLAVLTAIWRGERVDYDGEQLHVHSDPLLPTPVQQPRIPIWVAARWPGGPGAYRRAARYDGVFPIAPDPNRDIVTAEQVAELRAALGDVPAGFEIAINGASELDPTACAEAGATWWIETYFSVDEVKRRAAEGPPS
jgi:alkanesulfonate monooxygenase SsuD/methylene tetrahydromethanopterin reductase-like flavin-dependent oxidoreductase (luciferase family)